MGEQAGGEIAVIVGAGSGLSASLARACAGAGMKVALAARRTDKLAALVKSTGATVHTCDASPLLDLVPAEVEKTLIVSAYGGFLVAQEAARLMLPKRKGSLFFTGASASVKGYAQSAPFAMAKFALRGLAQSLARELQPKGIHVAHFVIDGGIASSRGELPPEEKGIDKWLDPDAIAATYLAVHRQQRSAWSTEMEVRPWMENF
jgi:NAD(P)-dependent dehydrogenase (short-subunit alcohol dehydrogenase family)